MLFRYSVKTSDDHLTTLQLTTSKPDVHFLLRIIDNDQEVACAEGTGHAVLPAFIFMKDAQLAAAEEEGLRPSSRTCNLIDLI